MRDMKGRTDSQGGSGEERITYLGAGMDLKGTVVLRGTIRVDCRIEGEIYTMGTLEVGEQGVIEGIIHVRTLFNRGTIRGTIMATEKVCLLKRGRLIGEVHTPLFRVEEGARFQGISHMGIGRIDQEPGGSDAGVDALSSNDRRPVALLDPRPGMVQAVWEGSHEHFDS